MICFLTSVSKCMFKNYKIKIIKKTISSFMYVFKKKKGEGSNTKSRSGRPRKMCTNKNELFMHTKDGSMLPPFQQPTIKEKIFIRNGNAFLLRNLKKVNIVD